MGRLDLGTKGYDLMLEVLATAKWRARPVRLHIFGDGPQRQTLERMAVRMDLPNVELCGWTDDVVKVWSEHHVCVLPSRQESMPIVLVEAMLAGRPIVATDVGGIREMLTDGVTGFLAAAPTVRFLDAALERAWTARESLAQMGQAAARAARAAVPRDPVGVFAQRLMDLV
jgi:glycosyltransferase involved in cell wall biosynthesis